MLLQRIHYNVKNYTAKRKTSLVSSLFVTDVNLTVFFKRYRFFYGTDRSISFLISLSVFNLRSQSITKRVLGFLSPFVNCNGFPKNHHLIIFLLVIDLYSPPDFIFLFMYRTVPGSRTILFSHILFYFLAYLPQSLAVRW